MYMNDWRLIENRKGRTIEQRVQARKHITKKSYSENQHFIRDIPANANILAFDKSFQLMWLEFRMKMRQERSILRTSKYVRVFHI